MQAKTVRTKKLALVIVFCALGVALSPLSWFEFLGTKAYPAQHMVNAILGTLAGPLWAALAATLIGAIRNMLQTGSLYAFPGGIPGGIAVGIVYWLLKRIKAGPKARLASAFAELLGTVLIGAPLALFLLAPWLGTQRLLDLTRTEGFLGAYLIFGSGWTLSCVSGSIAGFIVVLTLHGVGISRETLFGER